MGNVQTANALVNGQYAPSPAHVNGFFLLLAKNSRNFLWFDFKKKPYSSQILLQ